MPDTLIKKILAQTNSLNATLEGMPDLNSLLQAKTTQTGLFWTSFSGGLGSFYHSISSFFTLNTEGIIIAINSEDKLLKTAALLYEQTGLENDKKLAYKSGILFALIAVYVSDNVQKIEAYKKLEILFEHNGLLNDAEILFLCKEFLKPISLNKTFYPLSKIVQAWEMKGKDEALVFEAERHKLLIDRESNFSIKSALFLLGLDSAKLSKEKIIEASGLCRSKLKAIANLDLRAVRTNPLFDDFKKAEDLLISYVEFKQFSLKRKYLLLKQNIDLAENTDITETDSFDKIYSSFKEIESDIKSAIPIARQELPYITNQMILDRLGGYKDDRFEVEETLQSMAERYWAIISAKIESLLKRASELERTSVDLSQTINLIKHVCVKIEYALKVIVQIEGSSVEDSTVLSTEATEVTAQREILSFYLSKLEKKIADHADVIQSSIQSIIRLNQLLDKAEADMVGVTDIHAFISGQKDLLTQIDKKLIWLRALDSYSKSLANSEFQKNIRFQATLDDVICAVIKELSTLDNKVCTMALSFYLGPRNYNPNTPLQTMLLTYFKSKTESNLKEIAADLINDLKGVILEQQGLSVSLSAKDLVPEPILMTLETSIENLEAKKASLLLSVKTSTDQFNKDLGEAIKLIMKQHKTLLSEVEHIVEEKNSLVFSWRKNMTQILQHEQALQKDFAKLQKKLPDSIHKSKCISPEIVRFLDKVKKEQLVVDEKLSQLKTVLGNISYNAFQYMCLKSRLEQEKKVYLAQGKHDNARYNSLQNLWIQIDSIDNSDSDDRFSLLIKAVKEQESITHLSHKKIGFLGDFRSSRLQIMYKSLLRESFCLSLFNDIPSAQSFLNQDTLKYFVLKNYIINQCNNYQYAGKHHQDRHESLTRLFRKLNALDLSSQEDRFAALISAVREEEKITVESHLKIGLFGSWRPSRLETIYGKILAMGSVCEKVPFDTAEEHESAPSCN